jgi:hypothetical protein
MIQIALFSVLFSFQIFSNASDAVKTVDSQTAKSSAYKNITVEKVTSLDSFNGNIPGNVLKCEQDADHSIGFCGGDCRKENFVGNKTGISISQTCASFVDVAMPVCLKAIGCKNSAALCGDGYAKREGNVPGGTDTPSRHSSGDAMDLFALRCKDNQGNDVSINFDDKTYKSLPKDSSNGMNRYDVFRNCWNEAVKEFKHFNNVRGGGSLGTPGSIEPCNDLHKDHVHFSCPSKQTGILEI